MPEDIIRVLRVIEYVGPRSWVEDTVARSIHGTKIVAKEKRISAATLGAYPEIIEKAREQISEEYPSGPTGEKSNHNAD